MAGEMNGIHMDNASHMNYEGTYTVFVVTVNHAVDYCFRNPGQTAAKPVPW